MSETTQDFFAFYASTSGLPLIVLLITIITAAFAFVILFQQRRLLKIVIADLHWQNEQLGKRLQSLQLALAEQPDGSEASNDGQMALDISKDVLRTIEPYLGSITSQVDALRTDISRLSDNVSEQEQVSKAIEMARRGAKRTELVDATGISAEQADAIVKFHGTSA